MYRPDPMLLIARGESAEVLRLDGGRVLKLFHVGVDQGIMRREYEAAARASDEDLLVPRPLGWQRYDGRQGLVFEEVDGKPLLDRKRGWRLLKARSALRKLAKCHAEIHTRSASGMVHHQHDILWVRILSAEVDEPLRQAALERIAHRPRANTLCHGDLHPGNAVETARGIAVVDWSSGCAGDPAADVVRTELLLRYGQLRHPSRIARWLRHQAADLYLRQYRAITGMSEAALDYWRLPVAISGLNARSRMYRAGLRETVSREWRRSHA